VRPYLEKIHHKKRVAGVAQGIGPALPQNPKNAVELLVETKEWRRMDRQGDGSNTSTGSIVEK
jgi:hypothetical protein